MTDPLSSRNAFGETEFRIVKVRNRSFPHVANLKDDYSRILEAAKEEKRSRYIGEWVEQKIQKHYVELKIDLLGEYGKYLKKDEQLCEVLQRWVQE